MLMGMWLHKSNIYQVAVLQNCFESRKLLMTWFLSEKVLSGVLSEIHLVRRNMASAGQPVGAYKNYIQSSDAVLNSPVSLKFVCNKEKGRIPKWC